MEVIDVISMNTHLDAKTTCSLLMTAKNTQTIFTKYILQNIIDADSSTPIIWLFKALNTDVECNVSSWKSFKSTLSSTKTIDDILSVLNLNELLGDHDKQDVFLKHCINLMESNIHIDHVKTLLHRSTLQIDYFRDYFRKRR